MSAVDVKLHQVSFLFNVEATDPYQAALEGYKALITAMDDGKLGAAFTDQMGISEELVLDIEEADTYVGRKPLCCTD